MLILTQDSCSVCAYRMVGLEIILEAPDGILSDMGQVESHFTLFEESVSVGAR
jgi:hypothetical protein